MTFKSNDIKGVNNTKNSIDNVKRTYKIRSTLYKHV